MIFRRPLAERMAFVNFEAPHPVARKPSGGRTIGCRDELGFGATPGSSPLLRKSVNAFRNGLFAFFHGDVRCGCGPARAQVLATVYKHRGTMSLYVVFGSDSFLICLTSGDIVICQIILVSAEFSFVTSFRVPALASAVRRARDCDVRQTPMPHKGPQVSKRRLVCRPPSSSM